METREWLDDEEALVINWFTKEMTLACCDCGLVHKVKVVRHFPWFLLGAFQLKFTRDKKMTQNLRANGKDKEFSSNSWSI